MRTLRSELIDKGIVDAHRCEVVKVDRKVRKKVTERLSDRDLAELMGVYRDTYKRGKGGAIRRR